jgi:hypothetical protein
MTIQIEKGVPMPARNKYPFAEMAVGDSFFVAGRSATEICGNISNARKKLGFKFTTRTVEGGVRVWRAA